jgi:glycosyltransferase involved in cell wall biosynthesis
MKILMLSTSLGLGGADREVINLACNLKKRGHEIKVVAMVSLGLMGYEAIARGIDVETLEMPPGIPDIRVLPRLVKLIKTWNPDVLHSHMVHANILARTLRTFTPNLPVLVSTAQNVDESEGQRWRDVAYRVTDFLCDTTSNVSQVGVDRYIKIRLVPEHKIRFIPNSVDNDKFSPNQELRMATREALSLSDRFTWLAVGRFYLQKDYPTMIRAFDIIRKQHPESILVIAGEGELQDSMRDLLAELKLQENIKFLGPRQDISALMNAADAHVMSSAWEGMPLALLEAASTGLPIVSTDVGGVKETVISGETGFLTPAGDPVALAASMHALMQLPIAERISMGEAGRAFVMTNYGVEKITTQWEETYRQLLAKRIPTHQLSST